MGTSGRGAYRVQIDHLFGGSALKAVDAAGFVRLPAFVRAVIERRTDARAVVIGVHDEDNCLTGYDPSFRRALFADSERQRLQAGPQHRRVRRLFGLTDEAGYDASGRIALPPMMRQVGRIEGLALFVGTGGAFEIWNPRLAAESDDPALAELARWRLAHDAPNRTEEGETT